LLRYRHSFPPPDDDDAVALLSDKFLGHGLGEPDTWHIESIGNQGLAELDVQVARSDWYEQVVQQLGVGSYLIAPLHLPYGVPSWESTLRHMNEALRALVQGNPPGVFGECRAAIDALPGELAGEFPVDSRDALYAYNMTKLLLSQIASLTLTG
jgi:hypothetical protein